MKKQIIILGMMVLFISANACGQKMIESFEFLLGVWKVEGKELYESWEKSDSVTFSGAGYKMEKGEKKIHEKLNLRFTENTVVYEALVSDQNDGKTIPFKLNQELKDLYSFENLNHDFPQKIQYDKIHEDTLLVNVLGPEGKGFKLKLIRQK